ncbi:tripartite tricarboxylate transporter permease [Sinorhizobium sp. Sb3]|uniref:tripartite tricarboxylate transporter permease n=1 Tax=Sinorhizobium sp. Sb3 TaxID=1358417 RepID=UPI00071CEDA4|nr:tripartite tricarboxylate transporter permease [Sinorhizobium sp. Sb3]
MSADIGHQRDFRRHHPVRFRAAAGSAIKGIISLSLSLFVSTIGTDPVSGVPRFTVGAPSLIGGVSLGPVMIGVFAVAEILRFYAHRNPKLALEQVELKGEFSGQGRILWPERKAIAQGNVLGTLIGIVPGAGADIAAWISYRWPRNPRAIRRNTAAARKKAWRRRAPPTMRP